MELITISSGFLGETRRGLRKHLHTLDKIRLLLQDVIADDEAKMTMVHLNVHVVLFDGISVTVHLYRQRGVFIHVQQKRIK